MASSPALIGCLAVDGAVGLLIHSVILFRSHRLPGERLKGGDHGPECIQLCLAPALEAQQHLVGAGLPIQAPVAAATGSAAEALAIAAG